MNLFRKITLSQTKMTMTVTKIKHLNVNNLKSIQHQLSRKYFSSNISQKITVKIIYIRHYIT